MEDDGPAGREIDGAVGDGEVEAGGSPRGGPDPEFVERPRRRRFTAEYKLRVVREADACTRSGEVGALLRREGLYSSHLTEWRRARDAGALEALERPRGRPKKDPREDEIQALRRRTERAEAELEKARRVIIEVQGNASSLLGGRKPPDAADGLRRPAKRGQRGCEKRVGAAPVIHATPNRRAMSGARFALFFMITAWAAYCIEQVWGYIDNPFGVRGTIEAVVYVTLVTLLTAAGSAYLLARIGYLQRARAHRRVSRTLIDVVFDESSPTLTTIIPSYREQRKVIRQTLLSAALQEYPNMRIVLLIDDPPNPSNPDDQEILAHSRALPGEIAAMLEEPQRRFKAALDAFEGAARPSVSVDAHDLRRVAATYEEASDWLRRLAADEEVEDHVDAFLANEVILGLARDASAVATALTTAADSDAEVSVARVRQLYRRLVWIFQAELTSFERKRFASLSHEPNKAMNLNSYIGLMGGRYRTRQAGGEAILLQVSAGEFDLEVPTSDYILTLDADSMLLPDYCLRLVAYMERPENSDVAVVQTPYSAYRGAPTRLERIAGATTDIQHLVHQGLTYYGATFWVGANAVIRHSALDDVKVEDADNGFTIRTYIQDRTLIEDTDASLDIRIQGWQLENYPERLSYSATPPDLGALCIQRERWANGGLVILPRLWALMRGQGKGHRRAMFFEAFLRVNYLASIAWASIALWLLLFYPFDQTLLSYFAALAALVFFVAVSTDLRRTGYRRRDVFSLYGFNILLLAVNTVGAVKSIGQVIGGQKGAFGRTPKVRNRTLTPFFYLFVPFSVAVWSAVVLVNDIAIANYRHAAFAGINAVLITYVMLTLHGIRNTVSDIAHSVHNVLYRPARRSAPASSYPDWVTVLYHGVAASGETREGSAMAHTLAAIDQEHDDKSEIMRTERIPSPFDPTPARSPASAA